MRSIRKSDKNLGKVEVGNDERELRVKRNRDKSFSVERAKVTRHNDVSWYAKDPQLVKDAASIPFAEPLGPDVSYGPNTRSIPGVATLLYAPTVGPIGLTAGGQAPINLAAVHYYSEIRKANAGARNYDPNDLIQILLGMAGIYEAIAVVKRLYSALRDYQMTNRYYARRLVEAMNFDFNDCLAHIADLRYFINVAITRASVFAIPKDMTFLIRRIWMCESIFLDAPMRKAQTYIYMPDLVQKYNWAQGNVRLEPWEDGSNNTASGNFDEFGSSITFGMITNTIEVMISNMSVNTDVGIITGDLIKAYGEEGLFRMSQIDIDYHIDPLFNQEVLTQIHNSECVYSTKFMDGFYPDGYADTFALVQDGALLAYDSTLKNPSIVDCYLLSIHSSPKIGTTNYGQVRDDLHLLDMPIDPVSAEQVMVATRLMVTRSVSSIDSNAGEANYELINFGSEVLIGIKLFSLHLSFNYSTWLCNDTGVTISELLKYTTPFSYLPRGYVFVKQTDVPVAGEVAWLYDEVEVGTVDNYTILADSTLRKQHQTAVLSEFSIPVIGAGSKR